MRDDARAREGGARREDLSVLLLRRTADSKLTVKADSPIIRPVPSADRFVAGEKTPCFVFIPEGAPYRQALKRRSLGQMDPIPLKLPGPAWPALSVLAPFI